MRIFGCVHNGSAAIVSHGDAGVKIFRVARTIAKIEGPMDYETLTHDWRNAQPLKGNVSPDMTCAIQGAINQLF